MALDGLAVETFTEGRLHRDDEETQRQIDTGLAAARNYCGWHVTPVRVEEVVVDGPGGTLLTLPTLALSAITAVVEDGVELDVDSLEWSLRGLVRKFYGLWTARLSGVTASITHGYASAPDFESVVLSAIDRGAFAAGAGDVARVIGPFQYNSAAAAAGTVFTEAERSVLDRYALEWMP